MPTAPIIETMLTIAEIAFLSKVSQKTVRRWLEDKKLIGHRLGRQWRVSPDDYRTFIRARRQS